MKLCKSSRILGLKALTAGIVVCLIPSRSSRDGLLHFPLLPSDFVIIFSSLGEAARHYPPKRQPKPHETPRTATSTTLPQIPRHRLLTSTLSNPLRSSLLQLARVRDQREARLSGHDGARTPSFPSFRPCFGEPTLPAYPCLPIKKLASASSIRRRTSKS
jgi:hypothetical protein